MTRTRTDVPGALFIAAAALAARLAWAPRWQAYTDPRQLRRIFDGHERHYLDAFLHGASADPSPSFHPWTGALAAGLGTLGDDPRVLLVFSAAVGSLGAVLAARWTGARFGRAAGRWAGLFAALLPAHVAWSTSVYPVVLPLTLLLGAFAARRGLPAAALAFLAGALRPELGVMAALRGAPGLAGLLGAAAWWVMVGPPPLDGSWAAPLTVVRTNLPLVAFLGPPVLALGVLGLGAPGAWRLAVVALGVHVLGSTFDDYAPRHALLGGLALCALGGVAAARQGWLLGAIVGVGLALGVRDLSSIWAAPADLSAEARGLPAPDPACQRVSEEPVLAGQAEPSHLTLWTDPPPPGTCVLWGEEGQHRAWSSRGLRPRARRMRTLYDPVAVAAERVPGGWRLYHQLTPPRAPLSALSDPAPPDAP